MAFDLRSWLTGFALGLSGKPLPLSGKTPIGYSYNGTVLPALPEWDKEAYPYAVISYTVHGWTYSEDTHSAMLIPLRSVDYGAGSSEYLNYYEGDPIFYARSAPITEPLVWGEMESIGSDNNIRFDAIDWANFDIVCQTDIYKPAGEIYLAASEPVPVYE